MTARVVQARSRWRIAAVAVLCLVAGTVAASGALRPTTAEWTDPVYAGGDVVIGRWSTPVDAISAGGNYTCLLVEGQAWCSGESSSSVPKTGQTMNTNTMTLVDPGARGPTAIEQIDTGLGQTCVVAGGAAYCWGGGSLGNFDSTMPWEAPGSIDPVPVYAGDDDGETWGYRSPLFGQTVTRVVTGDQSGCAVMATGRAACWGLNTLLTRPPEDSNPLHWPAAPILVPTTAEDPASQLPDGTRIAGITSDFRNSCALDTAGALYCWGANSEEQLGLPAGEVWAPRALPRGASAGTGPITYAAMGTFHMCFLSDGVAYCLGLRAEGALGDGSQFESATEPVAVDATGVLVGVTLTQIVAGDSFTCALSDDGHAFCWGRNDGGQLGNNTTTNASVPVAVDMSVLPVGVTFTHIDAGTTHVCARGSDMKVYCWGTGASGEQATGAFTEPILRPLTPMTDTWTG